MYDFSNLSGSSRVSGTITLRSRSEMVAMGVGVPVGAKCFIKDGQVTGPAPDLPQYDVEV